MDGWAWDCCSGSCDGGVCGDGASGLCEAYSEAIVDSTNENNCAGAGITQAEYEAACNDFVETSVAPASCLPDYSTYVACSANSDACNPCRNEYCWFNDCMCAHYGSDPLLCLDDCS